jgi:hypothetical protein
VRWHASQESQHRLSKEQQNHGCATRKSGRTRSSYRVRCEGASRKSGTGSESSAPAKWIAAAGTGSANGTSVFVCVGANQEPTNYTYDVKIADVGYLDPIVRVKTKGEN